MLSILRRSLIERRLPLYKLQDYTRGQHAALKSKRDPIADERIDKARGIPGVENASVHRFRLVKEEWGSGYRIAERLPVFRALFQRGVEREDVLQIARSIRADHRARIYAPFFGA